MQNYWNHNTVFHDELVADARRRGGCVLDIGCGDGLLVQRLAPIAQHVVGLDPDVDIILRAQERLTSEANVSLVADDFLTMPIPEQAERYATILCVAALHHMDLRSALIQMRQALAPGGRLLIIGLAADKSLKDRLISGMVLLPIRFMDRLHGGMQDIGVRIAEPKESIGEIRQVAQEVLPGAVVRRRFYYRYSLSWDKPKDS